MLILMSFIKELLNTAKGKFFISHKDTLGAITLFFIISTGEMMTPIVLGIDIDKQMILRMLGVAFAGMIASLVSSKIVNKLINKYSKDKIYKFIIKFDSIETCKEIKQEFKNHGFRSDIKESKCIVRVISFSKQDSIIIKDVIEDKFKNYSIEKLADYKSNKAKK